MHDTPQLGLPLIEAAQAQKHVTHNEALTLLDALAQIAVETMNATTPPPDAQDGSRLHVGAAGEGVFTGRAGQIALRDAGAWRFLTPRTGWLAWSVAQGGLFVFDGAQWIGVETILRNLQNLERLGVGTAADAANPLAAKVNAALFAARGVQEGGSGDLRFTLNKESGARTVSQLYQTNWSGRAETGLMGDDRYRIKVSPDGGAWIDAIVIDPAYGQTRHVDGAPGAPGVSFVLAPNAGMWRDGNGDVAFSRAGVEVLRLTGNAALARAGSLDAPGYSFIGDTDTGLTNPATNTLCMIAGGAEIGRINVSGMSLVGRHLVRRDSASLGVGSTRTVLDLANYDQTDGNVIPIRFLGVDSVGALRQVASIYARIAARSESATTTDIIFATANNASSTSVRGIITGAGDWGVMTSAPTTRLHVNGPIRCGSYTRTTLPSASFVGAGTVIWVTNPASGQARAFWSNGTDWRDQAHVQP